MTFVRCKGKKTKSQFCINKSIRDGHGILGYEVEEADYGAKNYGQFESEQTGIALLCTAFVKEHD